jgi:hypothetical protein
MKWQSEFGGECKTNGNESNCIKILVGKLGGMDDLKVQKIILKWILK